MGRVVKGSVDLVVTGLTVIASVLDGGLSVAIASLVKDLLVISSVFEGFSVALVLILSGLRVVIILSVVVGSSLAMASVVNDVFAIVSVVGGGSVATVLVTNGLLVVMVSVSDNGSDVIGLSETDCLVVISWMVVIVSMLDEDSVAWKVTLSMIKDGSVAIEKVTGLVDENGSGAMVGVEIAGVKSSTTGG